MQKVKVYDYHLLYDRVSKHPLTLLFIFCSTILLTGFLIFILFLRQFEHRIALLKTEISVLSAQFIELQVSISEYDGQPFARVETEFPATTQENSLTISGFASDNVLLALTHNGAIISTVLPRIGKFQFPELNLLHGNNNISVSAHSQDTSFMALNVAIKFINPIVTARTIDFNRGALDQKEIALTFDGGASDNQAQTILSVLDSLDVRATFFLTGKFIINFPELTRRIAAVGYEVGNHVYNHEHLTTYEANLRHNTLPEITKEWFIGKLALTDSLYLATTGHKLQPYWRAPYGEQNKELREWAAIAGFQHIGWSRGNSQSESMDTHDWISDSTHVLYKTADEINNKLLSFGADSKYRANGGIILMHIGSSRTESFPVESLAKLITEFRQRGYSFVSVGKMLEEANR